MDLSIIITSWNTRDLLSQCLTSLFQYLEGLAWEVIVVDDGSQDGTAEMVRRRFPQVTLLENPSSLGFAVANNRGIQASRGRYVLLINSDTRLESNVPLGLHRFMERRPRAGATGCHLVGLDGHPQPYAYGRDPTLGYLVIRALTRPWWGREHLSELPREVSWVSAACIMLRRAALDQVGLLDEGMFMYFEDVDLCLRLRRAGWQVWLAPHLEVIHLGGGTALAQSGRRSHYYRSLLRLYRKHYGTVAWLALSILLLGYRAPQHLGGKGKES